MSRDKTNLLTGIAPAIMSLLAFAVAAASVLAGWERNLRDEGTAAHLFQLLIVAQIPLLAMFFYTADWHHIRKPLALMLLQIGALALAFGTVAWFRL